MYSLSDAYEKGSGSTFMTITMGIVASLLFTTGLFLIISTHNNSQSKQLQTTIANIKKALSESGDSSSAALLSLEAALDASNGKPAPTTLSISNLTVTGSSVLNGNISLQGNVKTSKDVTVGGNLDTKNNSSLEGNLLVGGTSEFSDVITADSDLQITGDLTDSGDTNLNTLETSSDISGGGDLSVTGDTTLGGDLAVTGDTTTDTLETNSDTSVGGDLSVTGDTTTNTLETSGNSEIGGTFESDGAASLDNGLTVSGLTTTDTLTTTDDATIGGDLTVTGNFNSGDTIADSITTTSDVTDGGNFQANGDSTFGNLDAQNQLLGSGNLTAYGDLNLGGANSYNFDVSGTANDITNQTFSSPPWTTTGWTVPGGGPATHNTGNVSPLTTNLFTPVVGTTYEVAYEVTGPGPYLPTNGSTITVGLGGQTAISTTFDGSANTQLWIEGAVTPTTTAGLSLTPSSNFNGKILGVYVGTGNDLATTDFTNGAWTSSGWTPTTTTATHSTGNTSALSTSQFAPVAGNTYQVTYTVNGATAGQNPAATSTLGVTFGGVAVLNPDSPYAGGAGSGFTESYIVTPTTTAGLIFTPSSSFNGVISNVVIRHLSTSNDGVANTGNDINFNFDPSYCAIDYGAGNCGNVSTLTIQGAVDGTNPAAPFSYLDVSGDMVAEDNLTVNGTLTATGSPANIPEIGSDLEIDGTLTIDNQNGQTDGIDVTGNGDFGSLSSDADTDVGGDLNVDGGANLSGDTIIGGDTDMQGDSLVEGDLTVYGGINVTPDGNIADGASGYNSSDTCAGHYDVTRIYNGIIVGVGTGTDNDGGVSGCESGFDLAEGYHSTQSLSPGDVVSIDTSNSEQVVKSSGPDDNLAMGVVSTDPGETLGDGTGYPIALSGRVPVNVTNEGGPIAPGDYLTSSSTPGYAMKAAPGDKTIGQALAGFSGTNGQVEMLIDIVPGNPNQTLQAAQVPNSGDANFTSLNVSGPATLSDLTVTGTATVNNLTVTGIASVATITINGHIIGNGDTAGTVIVPAGQTTVQYTFASAYAQVPAVVASPESSPTSFSVTPTTSGFNINLASPAAADIKFDYLVEQ